MARPMRKIIAIHEDTGERKEFESLNKAGECLGVKHTSVYIAVATGQAVNGWKVYDTPENIRKRIEKMKEDIKMLEDCE